MKRALLSLIFACLCIGSAQAILPGMMPGVMPGVSSGCPLPAFNGAYVTSASSTASATTYTFNSISTGAADCSRVTIVGASVYDGGGAANTIDVTVDGVATTQAATVAGAGALVRSDVSYIGNPNGTTASIVVTANTGMDGCAIGVWRVVGDATPTPTSVATDGSANDLSASLTIPTSGMGMGHCVHVLAIPTPNAIAWTNLTENFDVVLGDLVGHSGATSTTAGTSTRTCAPTFGSFSGALVLTAWGP